MQLNSSGDLRWGFPPFVSWDSVVVRWRMRGKTVNVRIMLRCGCGIAWMIWTITYL